MFVLCFSCWRVEFSCWEHFGCSKCFAAGLGWLMIPLLLSVRLSSTDVERFKLAMLDLECSENSQGNVGSRSCWCDDISQFLVHKTRLLQSNASHTAFHLMLCCSEVNLHESNGTPPLNLPAG